MAETNIKTGFVYGEVYLRHETGPGHVERPERLNAIIASLETAGLMARLVRIEPVAATPEQVALVHSRKYIQELEQAVRNGLPYLHSPDTPVSAGTYDAALHAAGGVLAAVDAVLAGRVRNVFCAVRPPGHHAGRSRAMGFCFFNNVAIAATHALKNRGLRRVLIIDWDVHHGNGTQDIFYDSPEVLFVSLHQYPFYPGTGSKDETGAGAGAGFTLNLPLRASTGDAEAVNLFETEIKPRALQFRPELVLISAGFDAHKDDLLGGLKFTAEGYAAMTRAVMDIADKCCSGRLVSVLEGGYNLRALAESVAAHVRTLAAHGGE